MGKNVGKVFEKQILKSTPDYALLYRLKDPAQSFGGGNLRFSSKNPFDYLMWDSINRHLFAIEAKTVSGTSISFEKTKDEKGVIHFHQIYGLNQWNRYAGIYCGFLIEFRSIEKTIFINIEDFNILIDSIDKKSFNFKDLEENKIKFLVVPQKKVRTRYTYDLDFLMKSYN